jgi:glyoxylase-like metal-dependent hydrolase (beta-lactamase superfamily II)
MPLITTPFFDPETHSYSYVVIEPHSGSCAVIDPVLNFDPTTRTTSTHSADEIVAFVKSNDLVVEWLLETHVHADHLSAARYLKTRFVCAQTGIGAGIREVRDRLGPHLPDPETRFDRLFEDDERIGLGHASGRVLATPGHTPACVSYRFEDIVFVGDTLFMPDFGSARCDFPGGDPRQLYRSIQRLLSLPEPTRLFMCHDYGPNGRPYTYVTTVAEERASNIHVKCGTSEDQFVAFRTERDSDLDEPALMRSAVPYNLSGGCSTGERMPSMSNPARLALA